MGILKNKFFIIGNILLLLAVIPITLYVVKRQTDLRSKAAPSTVLSFTPASASTTVGQTVKLDIIVDPGQNIVSIVEMTVQVDPDKFDIVSLERNTTAFSSLLKGPTINKDGTAYLSVSTSTDPSKAIQTQTRAATLTLKAKAATSGAPSIVKFSKAPQTEVLSTSTADGPTENVLSSSATASITVSGGGQSGGGGNPAPKPTCTAINLDKAPTGILPYVLTFTGVGSSSTGTITKASFNFGDGVTQDVTSGGGIGTNAASPQIAHTYSNPGTFNASVTFTDNANTVSDIGPCTTAITVSAPITPTIVATDSAQATPSPTLIVEAPTATPTTTIAEPSPTLPVTGTLQTTLTILGVAGATIGIGLLLFIL